MSPLHKHIYKAWRLGWKIKKIQDEWTGSPISDALLQKVMSEVRAAYFERQCVGRFITCIKGNKYLAIEPVFAEVDREMFKMRR